MFFSSTLESNVKDGVNAYNDCSLSTCSSFAVVRIWLRQPGTTSGSPLHPFSPPLPVLFSPRHLLRVLYNLLSTTTPLTTESTERSHTINLAGSQRLQRAVLSASRTPKGRRQRHCLPLSRFSALGNTTRDEVLSSDVDPTE